MVFYTLCCSDQLLFVRIIIASSCQIIKLQFQYVQLPSDGSAVILLQSTN